MSDVTTALMARLQRSLDAVSDGIAKDGLQLLRRVLEDAGFGKSEFLKDYDLYAHKSGSGEIVFEISLTVEALESNDESDEVAAYRKEAMESMENKFEEAAVKSFGLSKDGEVHRVSTLRDKRVQSRDTKRNSHDSRRKSHDTTKGSSAREFEHKAAAASPRALGAPRSMQVGRSGKLKLSFTRKLTKVSSGYQYPQGDFEGIMKKFVDGMQDVVARRFVPELEKILSGYVSE